MSDDSRFYTQVFSLDTPWHTVEISEVPSNRPFLLDQVLGSVARTAGPFLVNLSVRNFPEIFYRCGWHEQVGTEGMYWQRHQLSASLEELSVSCQNLRYLNFHAVHACGPEAELLASRFVIESFRAVNCRLSSGFITALSTCEKLKNVILNDTKIKEESALKTALQRSIFVHVFSWCQRENHVKGIFRSKYYMWKYYWTYT